MAALAALGALVALMGLAPSLTASLVPSLASSLAAQQQQRRQSPTSAESRSTVRSETALVSLELRPGPAFRRAVERGTRTASGEAGPRYWQQEVAYDISAVVDPASRLLRGEETVTYANNSPDTLAAVVFHLYQNLFAPGAVRTRGVPLTEGMLLEALEVGGTPLPLPTGGVPPELGTAAAADTAAPVQIEGTVMTVRPPQPLSPGGRVTFSLRWRFTIPEGEGVPRMGMADSTSGLVAQWYPQIATYDDLRGWDTRPYLSNGEFYLEYGDFDLAVTVPAGTLVAATGELDNPEEVLPVVVRERLGRARAERETVHVVTEADFGPGRATLGSAGETLTWRFSARDVRDVAFAFGDHYLWDATNALDGRVRVNSLYRPPARTWRDSARMTKDAAEVFSRNVYPYAYPHITSVEGLVGGMEYPMMVFVKDFEDEPTTQRVIAHEVGHEWFPMMVGSDETAFAWLDEGVNTFITIAAAEHYFPDSRERTEIKDRYRSYTRGMESSLSLVDPPDAIAAGGDSVGILGYRKPATALLALREIIGAKTFDGALTEYTERWLSKHPAPWDFFNTFEDVAGRDLDWFWEPWFFGTGVSDQAIVDVKLETRDGDRGKRMDGTGSRTVTITVRNDGSVLSPIRARITTADGRTVSAEAPETVWFDGSRTATVTAEVSGDVVKIQLDPEGSFADVDPEDDAWTPGPRTLRRPSG